MALIAELKSILDSEELRRSILTEELTAIQDKYGDGRRSRIIADEGDMSLEDLIADEELVVTASEAGYVKSVLAQTYRRQGRGGRGVKGADLREDDRDHPRATHLGARLPAVLHQPGQGLPGAGAPTPAQGADRKGIPRSVGAADGSGRDHRSDHRYPGLRDSPLSGGVHQEGSGQEDQVHRL